MITSTDGDSPPEWVSGDWSVTFIETQAPGAHVDYHQTGRIAPEIVSAGDLSMAVVAQPPSGRTIELLIDRAGEQSALYGRIAYDGTAEALTEDEFLELVRGEYPPPPGFPTPEAEP